MLCLYSLVRIVYILHLTIFKQWNLLPFMWETDKCSYPYMLNMLKYYRKNEFVENEWLAKSALFLYVSTQCVKAVKKLDTNR